MRLAGQRQQQEVPGSFLAQGNPEVVRNHLLQAHRPAQVRFPLFQLID